MAFLPLVAMYVLYYVRRGFLACLLNTSTCALFLKIGFAVVGTAGLPVLCVGFIDLAIGLLDFGAVAGRARACESLGGSCGLEVGLEVDFVDLETRDDIRSDGVNSFPVSFFSKVKEGMARRAGGCIACFLGGEGRSLNRSSISESSSSDTIVDFIVVAGLALVLLSIPSSKLESSSDTTLGNTVPGRWDSWFLPLVKARSLLSPTSRADSRLEGIAAEELFFFGA